MFQDQIAQLAYNALWMILILSAPPILISLIFGLLIAVFQAATQIQEQTLSTTVKLVTAILTIIMLGSWLGQAIWQYGYNIFSNFPQWGS